MKKALAVMDASFRQNKADIISRSASRRRLLR